MLQKYNNHITYLQFNPLPPGPIPPSTVKAYYGLVKFNKVKLKIYYKVKLLLITQVVWFLLCMFVVFNVTFFHYL